MVNFSLDIGEPYLEFPRETLPTLLAETKQFWNGGISNKKIIFNPRDRVRSLPYSARGV